MKQIAIFGATSAIAFETARLYAEQKASLFLVARDHAKLQPILEDLAVRGATIAGFELCDLSDTRLHRQLVDKVIAALPQLDIALLAWGTLGDNDGAAGSYDIAQSILADNLLGPISLSTELATRFETRRSGVLAVITSVAGDRGRKSNYVYGTAKGGLSIFLQGLRNRLSSANVRVLTIKPGMVDTPMTAHLKKGALFAQPATVALGIVRAIEKGKDIVYLPAYWRLILLIITSIPERIFKRMSI